MFLTKNKNKDKLKVTSIFYQHEYVNLKLNLLLKLCKLLKLSIN